ncbi:ABC transporter substrate-binding protein [Natronomonas sp. EA1]|uniref:ABC transporter substrate-binding protein n=1 Tax=Natronomonas sp. EA1 TaxID=3421655 RepID=UPI003EB92733
MFNSGKDSEDGRNSGNEDSAGANIGSVGRRSFLRATGASGVAVSLAGCTFNSEATEEPSGGGGGGSNNDGGESSDTETTEQPSGIEGPIKLGVLAPEPTNNPIGASIANGARLAVQQLNAEGGIAGAEIELVVKDTREDPAEGRRKYQELTVGEGVDATFGIFTSEVLLNIMGDIANQQTPHLTTGAATPEASKLVHEQYDKYKYHFRTGPINAHHLGVNMVDFADAKLDELGWESVAVLVEDYKWTEPVSAALDAQLADTGVEIVMSERYASGTENFGPLYDQVESSGADAAFIAMAHTGTAAVVQWAKQQRPFEFGGIHVPMQLPAYYGLTKGACRYGVTQNSATPQSAVTEKTIPFAEAFNEEFDGYPVYTGYITFDAVKQYAAVAEAQGSVEADAIVSGLEESSYKGTVGTVEYYGKDSEFTHDVIYAKDKVWPVFQQWQESNGEGVQEVIFPESLQTAEYQKPPWV